MFLLLVGGVETSSGKIISAIGGNSPSLWESSLLWIAIIAAMGSFVLTNKISAGGFSFQGSRESIMAIFIPLPAKPSSHAVSGEYSLDSLALMAGTLISRATTFTTGIIEAPSKKIREIATNFIALINSPFVHELD